MLVRSLAIMIFSIDDPGRFVFRSKTVKGVIVQRNRVTGPSRDTIFTPLSYDNFRISDPEKI